MLDLQTEDKKLLRGEVQPHLGLVCMTLSEEVRFRTITRTRYLKFSLEERPAILSDIYVDNLKRTLKALTFCALNRIKLYRLSSALFPFSDYNEDGGIGEQVLESMAGDLAQVGKYATQFNIRVVQHPDQFNVLSSDNPQIVENTVKALSRHSRALDLMGLPQNAYATMMIHGGKADRSARLIENIGKLPDGLRSRIAFENDENAYDPHDILQVCQAAHVPMVYDVHHHVCHAKLESYEDPAIVEMLLAARETWPHPEWQLVHLSNGKEFFTDRRHSNLIELIPSSYRTIPWIEVEAKDKEVAIQHLRELWPEAD